MTPALRLNQDIGFLRIGAALPQLRLADIDFNINSILEVIHQASLENVQVLAFPEMAITGYTINDLVQHQALLSKARQGLEKILTETATKPVVIIIGLPLNVENKVFNCTTMQDGGTI